MRERTNRGLLSDILFFFLSFFPPPYDNWRRKPLHFKRLTKKEKRRKRKKKGRERKKERERERKKEEREKEKERE